MTALRSALRSALLFAVSLVILAYVAFREWQDNRDNEEVER